MAGGLTTGMSLGKAVIVNAGMATASSVANQGNVGQDVTFAIAGSVVSKRLFNPLMSNLVSEIIQKSPKFIDKINFQEILSRDVP